MSAVTKIAEKQQKETQKRLDPYSPTSFSTGKIAMMLPFHQPLLQVSSNYLDQLCMR